MLEKNKQLLFKQTYKYGQSVDWNKYRIVEFAESCYITVDQVIKWATIYLKSVLELDGAAYDMLSKSLENNLNKYKETAIIKKELEKKYKLCEHFKYSSKTIKKYLFDALKTEHDPLKINVDDLYYKIIKDVDEYITRYLGVSPSDYSKYKSTIRHIDEKEICYIEKYQKLLTSVDLESIVKTLEDDSIDIEGISNFVINYCGADRGALEKNSIFLRLKDKFEKKEYYKSMQVQRNHFLKGIYDYCIEIDWNKNDLKLLSEEYQTDWQQIVNWAQRYAKAYLPKEEYEKLNSKIKDKLVQKKSLSEEIKLPYMNKILYHQLGKKTYLLWENEYDKQIVLQKIFDICKSVYFNEKAIKSEAASIGITPQQFMSCVKEYAIKYKKISKEKFLLYKEELQKEGKDKISKIDEKYSYIDFCKKLHSANGLNEIITVIEEFKKNIPNFSLGRQMLGGNYNITSIVDIYMHGNDNTVSQLMYKINLYKEYIENFNVKNNETIEENQNINSEVQKIQIAQETIKKYISEEDLLVDEFCNKYEIDKNEFNKYLKIIKEQDANLWNLYNSKTEKQRKKIYAILHKKIEMIIKYIKFGIEENGIHRPFDILDYYLITNMTAKEMLYICQNSIPENELWIIEKFFDENKDGMSHNENEKRNILEEKHIVDCQLDENNELMIETGRVFTDEEKMMIFNYLSSNKIPINLKTYGLAYKRYTDGTLELDNRKKSK